MLYLYMFAPPGYWTEVVVSWEACILMALGPLGPSDSVFSLFHHVFRSKIEEEELPAALAAFPSEYFLVDVDYWQWARSALIGSHRLKVPHLATQVYTATLSFGYLSRSLLFLLTRFLDAGPRTSLIISCSSSLWGWGGGGGRWVTSSGWFEYFYVLMHSGTSLLILEAVTSSYCCDLYFCTDLAT